MLPARPARTRISRTHFLRRKRNLCYKCKRFILLISGTWREPMNCLFKSTLPPQFSLLFQSAFATAKLPLRRKKGRLTGPTKKVTSVLNNMHSIAVRHIHRLRAVSLAERMNPFLLSRSKQIGPHFSFSPTLISLVCCTQTSVVSVH